MFRSFQVGNLQIWKFTIDGTCTLKVRTECKIFPPTNLAFKAEISFQCRDHVHRIKNSYRKPLCILLSGWLRRQPPISGEFYSAISSKCKNIYACNYFGIRIDAGLISNQIRSQWQTSRFHRPIGIERYPNIVSSSGKPSEYATAGKIPTR